MSAPVQLSDPAPTAPPAAAVLDEAPPDAAPAAAPAGFVPGDDFIPRMNALLAEVHKELGLQGGAPDAALQHVNAWITPDGRLSLEGLWRSLGQDPAQPAESGQRVVALIALYGVQALQAQVVLPAEIEGAVVQIQAGLADPVGLLLRLMPAVE